jgi:molecular chaperone DnaK
MGSDEQEVWGRWASATDRSDRDDRGDQAVTDYSNLPRDSTRVPLAHRIQLKFDRFSGFINEYFSNISPGGIFIRTDTPEPPGQLLDFEFRLGDGYELIHGRGEVVWARERGEGPERPPGMGVRFIELSPGSKDLIYKIVDDYVAHGGKPFDLTPPAGLGSEPPVPPGLGSEPLVPPGLGDMPPVHAGTAPGPAAAAPVEPMPGLPAPRSEAAAAAQAGWPSLGPPAAASPPSGSGPASPPEPGLSSLPWTLELPAIQQLPGVPAITPRSPLESLGAGAGATISPSAAREQAAGARSGVDEGAALAPTAFILGDGVPGHDPLGEAVAGPSPLDELAPGVPALPPAPASASAPAFSSFDQRASRRRSRMPLLGALAAVALLGLAVYLLRDPAMGWLARYQAARSERAPAAAARSSTPQAPEAAERHRAAGAASRGTLPELPGGPAAGARSATGAPGTSGTPPPPPAMNGGAPATAAAAGAPPPSAAAPAASAGSAPAGGAATAGGAASSPAGSTTSPPEGRAVLEPVATGGAERAAAGPAAAAARVTAVERITWQASGDGTDVVLWGNGEFTSQSYSRARIAGAPVREVVRITGIDRPYPAARVAVRTPELLQIRTGYHPPRELHIVLDLGSGGVQVTGIEPGPRQLRIHLRGK